jgi:class 3 adenylate cyclase
MDSTQILKDIRKIFATKWETRKGRQIPDTEDIQLVGNEAVELEGTVLYADMVDSTGLVDGYKPWFAAEIYKAYLSATCRIIRGKGGEITAFDGDRVMAVFIGTTKNSLAAEAGLRINYIVKEINNTITASYPKTAYSLGHCVGIDTSKLLVARTGIRNSNDLVWVGRAANYAAKMSAINDPGNTVYITESVYKKLNDSSKFGGSPKKNMWEKRTWQEKGMTIYRSNWWWSF